MPEAARRAATGVVVALAVVGLWALLDNRLERGLPLGIVGLGAVSGLLYAINAIGLVLIFRANRVINFAQAEFGSVAAVLAIQLSIHWRVPFFVSVAIALVSAAILGAFVEGIVLRRFARASRLILAVATIALAQILAGLSLILPLLWSEAGEGEFAVPFTAEVTIFPVTFDASHVLIVLTVPALVIALGLFLLKTDYGIAIRGAAENADRAGLLGVPVPRLATIVWVTAAVLSALAVVFRTTLVGYSATSASGAGNSLLLFTLAAAVVGKMENLPRTVAAAIFLGIFQEAAIWTWSNTTIVDGLLLVVILVGLLLQRHAFSRASDTGIATWRAVRDVRPLPAELRNVPEVRFGFLGLKLVLFALAVTLPLYASPSQSGAAALVLIYAIVAISLFVLTGWGGHISLGQFALAGFGGATTAVLYGRHGWDPLLAILAGIVVAGLVSLVLGLPAMRIKGLFLAVTTLAFAVTSATFFLQERYVPWFIERRIERPTLFGGRIPLETDRQMYWFALAALLLTIFGVQGLRASRTGRALIATRDNEQAAQAVTISTMRVKLTGFVISGALAGLAGGVYVLHQRGLHSDAFGADVSIRLFSMVVIGGLGSMPGAVLGAIYVRGAEFFLRSSWALVASGGGILVLLLFLPEGLGGLVYSQRDRYLRWVAKRRGIHVPSLVADSRVDDGEGASGELELPDPATELEAALR